MDTCLELNTMQIPYYNFTKNLCTAYKSEFANFGARFMCLFLRTFIFKHLSELKDIGIYPQANSLYSYNAGFATRL